MCIFQKIGKLAVIIQQKCSLEDTTNTVYLKYTRDANGDRGSHYDTIVDCPIPVHAAEELEPNFTKPHVAEEEAQFDSTPLSTPSTTTEESIESELYKIPDILPQQSIHQRKRPFPNARNHMDMLVFVGVQPQLMSSMQWAPDGNNIYVINTTEDYWHEKQKDGRHWQFSPSSCKGLNGIRKFGTCRGSFICKNDDCPKYCHILAYCNSQ